MSFFSRNCCFYSILILFFSLYWFVLTPLLWVHLLKPVRYDPKNNGIFWCATLFVFILLLIIMFLIKRCWCGGKSDKKKKNMKKNEKNNKKVEATQFVNAFDQSKTCPLPIPPLSSSTTKIKNNKLPPSFFRNENEVTQETSIEIISQTSSSGGGGGDCDGGEKSPMTPRELFFKELIQQDGGNTKYGSTQLNNHQISQDGYESETSRASKGRSSHLMKYDELYTTHKDLYEFILEKNRCGTVYGSKTGGRDFDRDMCKHFIEKEREISVNLDEKPIIVCSEVHAPPKIREIQQQQSIVVPIPQPSCDVRRLTLKSEIFIPIEIQVQPEVVEGPTNIIYHHYDYDGTSDVNDVFIDCD